MGVFDRLRRRDRGDAAGGPVLGDDILDLTAFGGWPGALAQLVGGAHHDAVLAHLQGRRTLTVGDEAWQAAHSPRFRRELRLALAIRCAMSRVERQRLDALVGQYGAADLLRTQAHLVQDQPMEHGRVALADLERAAPALGWRPQDVLDVVLGPTRSWEHAQRRMALDSAPDRDDYVTRHLAQVRAALAPPARKDHASVWDRLAGLPETLLAQLLPEACAAAAGSARTVREPADAVLRRLPPDDVVAGLREVATTGPAPRTAQALDALARLTDDDRRADAHAWAVRTFGDHRSKAVLEALQRLATAAARSERPRPDLPETRLDDLEPITGVRMTRGDSVAVVERVLNGAGGPLAGTVVHHFRAVVEQDRGLRRRLYPEHVARVLLATPTLTWVPDAWVRQFWQIARPSPLLIAAVAVHDGVDARRAVETVGSVVGSWPEAFTDAELAAWVDHAAQDIAQVVRERGEGVPRRGVLAALARVPDRPEELDDVLAEAAVTGAKADREDLYRIVGADHVHRVLPYLAARSAAARRGAAQWLRRHPAPQAIEPLLVAARAEQDDGALAAELTALDGHGADLDEFVSPQALLAQAERVLGGRSAIPKAVDWLDVAGLPALTWADGTPVERDVVRLFVVTTVRARSVEPSPVLRRHVAAMDADRARAFGRALFEAWLAEDTRTHSEAEAEARAAARSLAPNHHAWAQRGHGPHVGMSLQQVEDAIADQKRRELKGSATASKGLLALVAATAGGDVAERAMTYLRRHRGQRLSQGRSLLELLSWIDDPAAVQALMAVAARFRPKGLQDHALAMAEQVARRGGWTLEDLADRSVPDGGFDAEGRAVLDYGGRTFTARLADDLAVSLVADETGRPVRSLPAARSGEDTEQVAAVRQDLASAKKDLRATAKLQPDRLHLAMCTQREWDADDFTRFIAGHPVMVRLATRLIWRAVDGDAAGRRVTLFRPLTDATLLDAADDDVELPATVRVTIAHDRLLDAAQRQAWRTHLADYEVAALFPQLDRPVVQPRSGQTVLDDVSGTVLADTTLRAQMDRHCWRIGQVEDGGVAGQIVRTLPGADLVGVLDLRAEGLSAARFDGHWKVTLGGFYVVPEGAAWHRSAARPLTEVSAVLLSELYAELTALAGVVR